MKVAGNAIRPGMVIEHQGRLWVAVKIQWTQPGKGGAYTQVELKDIRTGTKQNERFRSADTVERVRLDQKDFQYLFAEGDMLTFMDTENFEQIALSRDLVGDPAVFLQDGMIVTIESHEGSPLSVSLPDSVIVTVQETEPTVKGQTASSSYKPAKVDNDVRVMVPPFIGVGDRIVVDTADSTYVERAKT